MDLFDLLGKFANIVQIIMFCVFVWATVTLLIARKRIERKLNLLEKDEKSVQSKRRIAIVIGIGKNPLASVEKFLADNNWADIPIINWISDGFLQAGDYTATMAEINDLRSQALKLGVSEVLLFYAGPIDLAMFIGASPLKKPPPPASRPPSVRVRAGPPWRTTAVAKDGLCRETAPPARSVGSGKKLSFSHRCFAASRLRVDP